jgi:uncharacterized protein
MERYLAQLAAATPSSKIILLSGPRQVGKTTLARALFPQHVYLNWDNIDHRTIIRERSWSRDLPCVIFDELHKMPRWKAWLKGIYDVEKERQQFVVTGSARLNTYRKVGDSLAGRYFSFTLHPFDLKEGCAWYANESAISLCRRLSMVGGFPEPFISGDEAFYKMWRKSHLDVILRQDLIDLKTIQQITKVELLIDHLRKSVGSPISFKAIGEDLQVSDNTVRSWLQLLEDLYVVFRLAPHGRNVKRTILKAPKIYFHDIPLASSAGEGGVFENLVACALLKEIQYRNDAGHGEYDLQYLRNKDSAEIDFLILKEGNPILMIEAKISDSSPSKHFRTLGQKLIPKVRAIQLVRDETMNKDHPNGVSIRGAAEWLAKLDF